MNNKYIYMFLFLLSFALNQNKYAVIVGVDNYKENPLINCINDANGMTNNLEAMGFEVTPLLNASQDQIMDAIWRFDAMQLNEDDVILFYFSGHGAEDKGKLYLMPLEMHTIKSSKEYAFKAVNMNWVQKQLEGTGAGTRILIVDACRVNDGWLMKEHFGLKSSSENQNVDFEPSSPKRDGTFIAYATAPNTVSKDWAIIDGEKTNNGAYTHFLLQEMIKPGLKIEDMFKNVRKSVINATKDFPDGSQIPWESSSLINDFYFTEKEILVEKTEIEEQESTYDEDYEEYDFFDISNSYEKKCLNGNCKNGEGQQLLTDGSIYEGGFKKGKFNGEGSIYYPTIHETGNYPYYDKGEAIVPNTETIFKAQFKKGAIIPKIHETFLSILNGEFEFYFTPYNVTNINYTNIQKSLFEDGYSGQLLIKNNITGTAFELTLNGTLPIIEELDNYNDKGTIYLKYYGKYNKNNIIFYSGDFVNGIPDCEKGCIEGDCENGTGKFYTDDCSLYEGTFYKGRITQGSYITNLAEMNITSTKWENGIIKEGTVYDLEEGSYYIGEVKHFGNNDIMYHGFGKYFSPSIIAPGTLMLQSLYSEWLDDETHGLVEVNYGYQDMESKDWYVLDENWCDGIGAKYNKESNTCVHYYISEYGQPLTEWIIDKFEAETQARSMGF